MKNTKGLQKPVLPAYWPKTGNPLWAKQDTINKIGYAYDTLYLELTGLAKITEKKLPDKIGITKRYAKPPKTENQHFLDRKRLQDIQIQATTNAKNHTQIFTQNKKNKTIQHLEPEKEEISRTASTMTRGPLKSTGVGQNTDEYNTDYDYYKYTKSNQLEKCCQDHGCQNIF
ncbi:unnamed protein product [Diatraea saccharalis]|uniref:Uncharacterized protein n=1 Tax=Diatraea saccharalis TaxID=40085 RepID=A0A9N9QYQ7_9NEOP|nr:unnamed protein product [Diatraea saccharalis]